MRGVFAFAEMTNIDPNYTGPKFDFDKIIKDLMNKVEKQINLIDCFLLMNSLFLFHKHK